MKFCYVDESGGTEKPDLESSSTPVLVIAALIIDSEFLKSLTFDFLALKRKHFAAKFQEGRALDHILTEIKGTQILSLSRSTSRNKRRQADAFRDGLIRILEKYEVKLIGKAWVKKDGESLNSKATYTYAMQDLFSSFNHFLTQNEDIGIVIADSRDHDKNREVSHSIFTQKNRAGQDPYSRIPEVITFATSDNHAGIQLTDLVASSLLFPMITAAYSPTRNNSTHSSENYVQTWTKYASDIKETQYRYQADSGRWRGGLEIKDLHGQKPSSALFATS